MNEFELYDLAVNNMSDKGRHKLANYMKHGYTIEPKMGAVILNRDDKLEDKKCLILLDDGRLFIGSFTL